MRSNGIDVTSRYNYLLDFFIHTIHEIEARISRPLCEINCHFLQISHIMPKQ
jgi:hypothetical protein